MTGMPLATEISLETRRPLQPLTDTYSTFKGTSCKAIRRRAAFKRVRLVSESSLLMVSQRGCFLRTSLSGRRSRAHDLRPRFRLPALVIIPSENGRSKTCKHSARLMISNSDERRQRIFIAEAASGCAVVFAGNSLIRLVVETTFFVTLWFQLC